MATHQRRRTRTVLTGLITAALATTVATALGTPASAAPAHFNATVAGYGAGYLGRQLDADGGHFGTAAAPDVSDTAYAVLALHAAGVGRTEAATATSWLATELGAPLREPDGTDNPGLLGYDILAAVADRRDPHHFGGSAAQNNLVARLEATEQPSGLFGTSDPTFDGAFREGIALTALRAAGVPAANPTVAKAIAWLRGQQCADGLAHCSG